MQIYKENTMSLNEVQKLVANEIKNFAEFQVEIYEGLIDEASLSKFEKYLKCKEITNLNDLIEKEHLLLDESDYLVKYFYYNYIAKHSNQFIKYTNVQIESAIELLCLYDSLSVYDLKEVLQMEYNFDDE